MNEALRALADHQRDLGVPDGGDVQAMLIEISFDDLESETERAYFNALPTSFNLPAADIDRLQRIRGQVLNFRGRIRGQVLKFSVSAFATI